METPGPERIPGVASAESAETLPEHSMIGEFDILGIIGEGGFGTVYLAIDHSLQRKVALKEYRPPLFATRQGKSVMVRSNRYADAFEAGLKSFMNEARTLARFDHPALIHVYRVWQQNNTAYMAMPLCEGRSLTSVVQENPELVTEAWLKAMLAPLLEAVNTLHSVQIYHRDIAPDNVLIQENGAPMLLDFGAARHIATDRTQALTMILKSGYAPIEQFADDPSMKQGPWTDIYALGAVMYFAITGKPPPNSVARLANDPLKSLASTITEGYSQQFLSAIDAALAVRPENRPQSIAALCALLDLPTFMAAPRAQMHASLAPPTPRTMRQGFVAKWQRADASLERWLQPLEDWFRSATSLPGPAPKAAPVPVGAASFDPQPTVNMPGKSAATGQPNAPGSASPVRQSDPLPDASHKAPAGSRKRLWVLGATVAVVMLGVAAMFSGNPFHSAPLPVTDPGADIGPTAPPGSNPAPPASPADPRLTTVPAAETALKLPAPRAASSNPVATQPQSTSSAQENAPAMGTIRLAVRPWGEIFVDGVSKGASPPLKRFSVPEGVHRVEVSNPGFPSYSVDIQVPKNQTATVSYQFK